MIHNDGIKAGIAQKLDYNSIARKIYLAYPTFAFIDLYELEFEILDAICAKFNLPINSIQVAGSSKTGYSYHQNRAYKKGESDLDIAIIDQQLFLYYCESVFEITKGFSNLSGFGRTYEKSNHELYGTYILRGIFRPDLMPKSKLRTDWFDFFADLSKRYTSLFSSINAGIYLSEYYFETKQSENIELFLNPKQ